MIINLNIPRLVLLCELEYLIQLVKDYQPSRILEVGAARGAVSWHLLANSNAELHSVDIWNGLPIRFRIGTSPQKEEFEVSLEIWHHTVRHFGDRAIPYHVSSLDVELEGVFDMIWIDGGHDYDTVINDLNLAKRHLAPGGILVGHDTHIPETKLAVTDFAKEHDLFYTEPVNIIWRLS